VVVVIGLRLDKQNTAAGKQLIKLLSIPVDNFNNILTVLKLESYPPLLSYLSYSARKGVAASFGENVLKNDTYIDEADEANKFLELIAPLVRDEEGQVDPPEEEFAEEQNLIARMIHLFENTVADKQYLVSPAFLSHGDKQRKFLDFFPLLFCSS